MEPKQSAQETPSNTGGGNNVTASLSPTGKEDVSSVVKQASPAVVKIETLAKQSSRSGAGQGGANTSDPLYQYFFGGGLGGPGGNEEQEPGQGQQISSRQSARTYGDWLRIYFR